MSEESIQQQSDAAMLDRIEEQAYRDPRTEFASSYYKTTVIVLLLFIARKLNKPSLEDY